MTRLTTTSRDAVVTARNKAMAARQRINGTWTREKVSNLIKLYRQHECLWNHFDEAYKNREARNSAIAKICKELQISKFDYGKKIHNLRNQFNSELKLLERRLGEVDSSIEDTNVKQRCRWEHFSALLFLRSIITRRPGSFPSSSGDANCSLPKKMRLKLDFEGDQTTASTDSYGNADGQADVVPAAVEASSMPAEYEVTEYQLAEITSDENDVLTDQVINSDEEVDEKHDSVYASPDKIGNNKVIEIECNPNGGNNKPVYTKIFSMSKTNAVPSTVQQLPATAAVVEISTPTNCSNSSETQSAKSTSNTPNANDDQWSDFGKFIAHEFRNLRSDFAKRKLKLKIMNALLEIDTEDFELNNNSK